ncbi:MAG: hypothetical protein QGG54_15100, partial [Gammaproteobacteria bacterium]|nr:hypothetical protein [Gammaproteobacteria bacterium]
DDVRIYDEALDQAGIDEAIGGGGIVTDRASNPSPGNNTTWADPNVTLSWTAGIGAATHNVYFGTSDSNLPSIGNQGPCSIVRSVYYPNGLLTLSETYYWRIDEVGANTVTGTVWNFTVRDVAPTLVDPVNSVAASSFYGATTDPNKTIDGSGMTGDLHTGSVWTDMWMTVVSPSSSNSPAGTSGPAWIYYELDDVYDLHKMHVWNWNFATTEDRGLRKVIASSSVDGNSWTSFGHELARATGSDGYKYNNYSNSPSGDNVIDFGGVNAKYVVICANSVDGNWGGSFYGLSEVRFLANGLKATNPSPTDGAGDQEPAVMLSWTAGADVNYHKVYFSTDEDAVINRTAPDTNVSDPCLSKSGLSLDETYHWAVDEIGSATYAGPEWDFSTKSSIVIDNMESYGGANTPGVDGGKIYYVWKDGVGFTDPCTQTHNGSGSSLGNARTTANDGGLPETGTVNSGSQSMRYRYYTNGLIFEPAVGGRAYYAEISADTSNLDSGSDWTGSGATVLRLYFYGDDVNNPHSALEQLYVGLGDSDSNAFSDYSDMNDVNDPAWHQWDIPLTDFSGITLSAVERMYIGFGDRDTPSAGGYGAVLFDDIELVM